ncbi:MAG: hypothetical protein VKN60_04435 [Cyanobacteriota bacterium]|nr:hypothetical protein [Cyanobacteriota bacterium]
MRRAPAVSGLILLASLGLTLSPALAQKSQNSFDAYYQECLQRVKKQGLAPALAQDICQCTIAEFKQRYSLPRFQALVQKSKTDPKTAQALAEVGEDCFFEN